MLFSERNCLVRLSGGTYVSTGFLDMIVIVPDIDDGFIITVSFSNQFFELADCRFDTREDAQEALDEFMERLI
jgi:hypothetical protein